MNAELLFLIPLLPLLAAAVNILFGMHLPRRLAVAVAVTGVAVPAFLTLAGWSLSMGEGTRVVLYTWLESGSLKVPVEILFDRLSAPMTLMVTVVSATIHIYAAGYMESEKDYARFFALLNLFVFAMLTIVLSDNLLLLFLGWEGVGFCSYGLIGFWYRDENNARAGRKAFIVTRVGDVFLGIALLWLFSLTETLSISGINTLATDLAPATVTVLALLLLGGACGKSAQLPLMTWLPDAMAGPTPVSALIHAATMVTAGVYLLCRFFPLVSISSFAMAAIAVIGAVTAFYAATCALAQREIKRILAYSTMSQIGYMFLAVGAGSVAGAMFHLFTHAFFKALLFMGAGCLIHLAGEENDIHAMGGMGKKSVPVFWLFLAGALCLAGFPLTGGFFSKDAILLAAFTEGSTVLRLCWLLAVVTAFLTALYTFRLLYLVFAGDYRGRGKAHRLPPAMVWTLVPLAVLGVGGGLLNLPPAAGGNEALSHWLGQMAGRHLQPSHILEWSMAGLSAALVAGGWLVARQRFSIYRPPVESAAGRFLLRGWHADRLVALMILRPFDWLAEFFSRGIDGTVIEGILDLLSRACQEGGELLRRLSTGRLSSYIGAFAWGLVVILGWYVIQALVR
ncbi:MAG: NADH-quinone oxidoreductase subunit L [Desulfuromonadales bacterium]